MLKNFRKVPPFVGPLFILYIFFFNWNLLYIKTATNFFYTLQFIKNKNN